jgi:hypothetical protein
MKMLSLVLVCNLMAGCHVLSPMPGDLTRDLSQEQMTVAMEQHLKPGMTIDDARAFLKKEGYTVGNIDVAEANSESITFTRREQIDFWVHQDWTIKLDCHQGRVSSHSIKASLTGP